MFHVLFHMVGVLSFNRKSKFSALARDFKEMYGKRKDAKQAPHIQSRDSHKPESLRCVIDITPVRKRSNDGSCHPKSSFSQWVFNLCCLWSQNLQRALCPCVLLKGLPTTQTWQNERVGSGSSRVNRVTGQNWSFLNGSIGLRVESGCELSRVASQVKLTRIFQFFIFYFFEVDAICQVFMSSLTIIRFSLMILLPITTKHLT